MVNQFIKKHQKLFKYAIPLLFYIMVSFWLIYPQLSHHALILGIDSNFHFNQYYEAMKQIQTGHFSYYQSLFSFGATGRIVNAIYGPFLAYFCGLILLFSKNWLHFQFITSLMQLTLGGYFIHLLSQHCHIKTLYSYLIGLIYMSSFAVSTWSIQQEATGWGAMLMPLVLWQGINALKHHDFNWIYLALAMALLMQVHLISAILIAVALIPCFVIGFIHTKHNNYDVPFARYLKFQRLSGKKVFLIKLLCSIGLTLLLTINLWSSILILFTHNHLIPIFPQQQLSINAIGLHQLYYFDFGIGLATTIILIAIIILILCKWTKLNLSNKVMFITGLVFLYVSSKLFPWQTMHNICPTFTNLIQFPRRLLVVAMLLILLVGGKVYSQSKFELNIPIVVLPILTLCVAIPLVHNHIWMTNEATVYQKTVFNEPRKTLILNHHNLKQWHNILNSGNKTLAIQNIKKATPDYLPTNKPINNNQQYYNRHFYHYCNYSYLTPNEFKNFHRHILGKNTLELTWKAKNANKYVPISLPLTAYKETLVKVNHKQVQHPIINQVGALQVFQHKGVNKASITFHANLLEKLGIFLTIIVWLITLGYEDICLSSEWFVKHF